MKLTAIATIPTVVLFTAFIIFMLLGPLAHANPITDLNPAIVNTDIKKTIKQRHNNRYSIINLLIKKDTAAYVRMTAIPDGKISDGVMERLIGDHYPNFRTIETLWIRDMEAYREMQDGNE